MLAIEVLVAATLVCIVFAVILVLMGDFSDARQSLLLLSCAAGCSLPTCIDWLAPTTISESVSLPKGARTPPGVLGRTAELCI